MPGRPRSRLDNDVLHNRQACCMNRPYSGKVACMTRSFAYTYLSTHSIPFIFPIISTPTSAITQVAASASQMHAGCLPNKMYNGAQASAVTQLCFVVQG